MATCGPIAGLHAPATALACVRLKENAGASRSVKSHALLAGDVFT